MKLVIPRNSWDDYPWEIQGLLRKSELHLLKSGLNLGNSTPQKSGHYN